MAFLVALTREERVSRAFSEVLTGRHALVVVRSWERLETTVETFPVTGALLDADLLDRTGPGMTSVRRLVSRFPSVGLTLVTGRALDPLVLFRLGRLHTDGLVLLPVHELKPGLARAVAQSLSTGPQALVARAVSPYLPAADGRAVQFAVEAVERGWCTEEVATRSGFSRPHLSQRLRSRGLPSLGRVLVWGRLLHAGAWLTDPGRSGESVSRQLGYANGSVFRRTLRGYLGVTPTQVKERGGLGFVLERFLDHCALMSPFRSEGRPAA